MGFYDSRIKYLFEHCPRLVIMSINSIFGKKHSLESPVEYLDKEQIDADRSETFMDMLIRVGESKYHFEFQLLEDNMAIRMYEYCVKETIREIHSGSNTDELMDRYEIEIIMPAQAVIFLAGSNKRNEIRVKMTLPDQQKVEYTLPCISASASVEELIAQSLFILVPFQQVQLNERMNHIRSCGKKSKCRIASEITSYHKHVEKGLEILLTDAIISTEEYQYLKNTLYDLEKYLSEKDEEVKKEVESRMGDKDYIPWSERIMNEGIAKGRTEGETKGRIEGEAKGRTAEIFESVLAGDYSIARGAEKLGLSVDEFVQMMDQNGYKITMKG